MEERAEISILTLDRIENPQSACGSVCPHLIRLKLLFFFTFPLVLSSFFLFVDFFSIRLVRFCNSFFCLLSPDGFYFAFRYPCISFSILVFITLMYPVLL
jgi:hypothetical protein